jgi:hypothetical protein
MQEVSVNLSAFDDRRKEIAKYLPCNLSLECRVSLLFLGKSSTALCIAILRRTRAYRWCPSISVTAMTWSILSPRHESESCLTKCWIQQMLVSQGDYFGGVRPLIHQNWTISSDIVSPTQQAGFCHAKCNASFPSTKPDSVRPPFDYVRDYQVLISLEQAKCKGSLAFLLSF